MPDSIMALLRALGLGGAQLDPQLLSSTPALEGGAETLQGAYGAKRPGPLATQEGPGAPVQPASIYSYPAAGARRKQLDAVEELLNR